mgnify:CR=1 FL=1|jgi:LDH2 family malate/lactate/ureidoglycolate dehydrogenase
MSDCKRIRKEKLAESCTKVFQAAGVPKVQAGIVSDALITTDMRGIHSHGVIRAARYIDCIMAGGIIPTATPVVLTETPATAQVSAAGGLGIAAASYATNLVIEKARKCGITVVTVNHSDHYGAAGIYSLQCADAGLVGFSMSNTCPLVAPTGGAKATIGNNPFSYAAPGRKYRAILFDICMSMVASGKMIIAAAEGKKIPYGWILDSQGNPTDDPNEIYRDAIMLPFAEHKGYGFAMMVEMLTGCLGHAGITEDVHSWNTVPGRDADTGHCFIAIDPAALGGINEFRSRVDLLIDRMRATPVIKGVKKVFYPGEIEFDKEADALANGVPVPESSLAELRRGAKLVGVELDF